MRYILRKYQIVEYHTGAPVPETLGSMINHEISTPRCYRSDSHSKREDVQQSREIVLGEGMMISDNDFSKRSISMFQNNQFKDEIEKYIQNGEEYSHTSSFGFSDSPDRDVGHPITPQLAKKMSTPERLNYFQTKTLEIVSDKIDALIGK